MPVTKEYMKIITRKHSSLVASMSLLLIYPPFPSPIFIFPKKYYQDKGQIQQERRAHMAILTTRSHGYNDALTWL